MKRSGFLFLIVAFAHVMNAQPGSKQSFFNREHPQSNHRSGAFLYSLSVDVDTYTDLTNPISVNNGEIWDDPTYSVAIGFPFNLNGQDLTHLTFFGLGFLLTAPTNDPDIEVGVLPFEADLIDRGSLEGIESLSPIGYTLEGAPGSRIFKLEIRNAGSYDEINENGESTMFINLQMWLYEGSNKIEFRYGPSSINNEPLFYSGEAGAYIGVTALDISTGDIYDAHFLAGNAAKPALSDQLTTITGTPPPGFVYILSLPADPLELDLTSENSTSYCNPNGSATATVTGGLPPYAYAWSNGGSTATINNLDAGSYTVTVTDDEGSTISATINIDAPDEIEIVIITTDETGTGAEDGTATALVDGGSVPYSLLWSNGETTPTITDLAPGIYTLTVTDDAGCTATSSAVINAFGCPELEVILVESGISCFGVCDAGITVDDVINGTAPYTYAWSNGGSGNSINNLCPGTYSVTVTDNLGCIASESITLMAPALLSISASATAESVQGANDGTATVVATGGTTPYAYLWSNGDTTQTITGLTPGLYSVTVTDNNNCTAEASVLVEAGPCGVLGGDVTHVSCNGLCDGSIDLDEGWASYQWSNGSATGDLTNLCAGEYVVTATDADGCVVIAVFEVNEPASIDLNAGSTGETIAGGDGTAWVAPTGGTPPYDIQWENGSTDTLITGLVAGFYTVALLDANGCMVIDSVEVAPFNCFTIDLNEVMHVGCHDACDGLIFVVPQGGIGPFEYAWSHGDTANAVFDLCAGLYGVTITDLGQGCTSSVEVEITQPDSFYFTIEEIVPFSDTSAGAINVTFHGGTSPYFPVWFGPNLFISFDEDISDLAPGEYILNLFDSHDCDVTDTLVVPDLSTSLPVLPEGVVEIYPNPASTFIQIDVAGTSPYTVELVSSLGVNMGTWENTTQIDVSALVPGVYAVMFKNGEGYFTKKVLVQ